MEQPTIEEQYRLHIMEYRLELLEKISKVNFSELTINQLREIVVITSTKQQ